MTLSARMKKKFVALQTQGCIALEKPTKHPLRRPISTIPINFWFRPALVVQPLSFEQPRIRVVSPEPTLWTGDERIGTSLVAPRERNSCCIANMHLA
jgi:hypothetical protein